MNNVFDEDPPLMLGEQDQSRDINTFDPLGRHYYVSLRYKFCAAPNILPFEPDLRVRLFLFAPWIQG